MVPTPTNLVDLLGNHRFRVEYPGEPRCSCGEPFDKALGATPRRWHDLHVASVLTRPTPSEGGE